ncbi:MAG TPA: DUF6036 family nucleotidyltransferase [Solirubrobacteraceae bacterium]|jgi:hypothetical protein|nr:DUF6036 family nucleotidyltransferase [Solirubrobacteraceae bacterium]
MSASTSLDAARADTLLAALGEQLAVREECYTLVVVGGSALLALGLVARTTRDVDVLAILDGGELVSAEPLPPSLLEAGRVVALDFGLPMDWLNAGPASLLDLGLPEGFLQRAQRRSYGEALTVLFASRTDQIHFKLYAAVDQGAGRHFADLQALEPTEPELLQAARWSRTHDPSEGYRSVLLELLTYLGATHGSDHV